MRFAAFIVVAAALAAPNVASACAGGLPEFDSSMAGDWSVPSIADVEDAIDAAAAEFGVPASLLQAVAHTESRWGHHPYRISQGGRRGLFQLSPDRMDLAADLIEQDLDVVRGDVVQHARGFAA